MRAVLSICRKSGASSVFARAKGRWCCATHPGWPRSMGMRRRKPVLGYQEMVLTIRGDEQDARVGALVLTSPEPAWTEMCFFIPQSLLRRRGEIPERTLDVRRAVGGLRRCCECR